MQSGYKHRGIISDNAVLEDRTLHLDSSPFIPDECYHPPEQLGNIELWYADVYDPVTGSVFVVQFTCGPDALKKETVLFISFHSYTPDHGVTSTTRQVPAGQLHVIEDPYQVTLEHSVIRAQKHPDSHRSAYHIHVKLEDVLVDIIIEPVVTSWIPFGEKIAFHDTRRKGIFSWIPAIPKGKVSGSVTIGQSTTKLTDAHGYYDHTYWETGTQPPFHPNPLFWDDVVVRWMWLKIIQDDIKIAVNEFRFRPWLDDRSISSFLVCKGDSIVLSSNHEVRLERKQTTPDIPYRKAGQFNLSCSLNDMNLMFGVTPTNLLRYQDMLEYTHPVSRPLVKMVFGSPVAFYSMARVDVNMTFGTEKIVLSDAVAFYEPMVLNTRPSRFEDRVRRMISKRISRRV